MTRKFEFLTLSKSHARFARELVMFAGSVSWNELYVNNGSANFITVFLVNGNIAIWNCENCVYFILWQTEFIITFSWRQCRIFLNHIYNNNNNYYYIIILILYPTAADEISLTLHPKKWRLSLQLFYVNWHCTFDIWRVWREENFKNFSKKTKSVNCWYVNYRSMKL